MKWVRFLHHQCKVSGSSMWTEIEIQHTCKKETDKYCLFFQSLCFGVFLTVETTSEFRCFSTVISDCAFLNAII